MSQNPIKTCDHCGATGEMPTFMSGETSCFQCLKKGDRRKWKREDVEAYCRDNGMIMVPEESITGSGLTRGMYHCHNHDGHGFMSDCLQCNAIAANKEQGF